LSSSPRKRGSSFATLTVRRSWAPAFAGVTA